MHILERSCIALRHLPWVSRLDWLWNWMRPHYERLVGLLGRNGLERTINGADRILILPRFRRVTETYEPDVWKHLMAQVQPGDVVADVGAFIGLYTIALARRVGPSGKVVAFEPDLENFAALRAHVELNGVGERVELVGAVVGAEDGVVPFDAGKASESHVGQIGTNGAQMVQCVHLDTVFANERLSILKIDVEGYEERVLQGSMNLLSDRGRGPRLIYMEVHPYAWHAAGTSSQSLLGVLREFDYRVVTLGGEPVSQIGSWNWVVASRDD